jgi:multidrug efflux pump subunit AcrA (membrane-fusion protein)
MSSASLVALSVLLVFTQLGDADKYSAQVSDPVIEGLVKVADDVKLPAREAGVLVHLAVEEGDLIKTGQILGQIDDSVEKKQREAAFYALKGAVKRWKDDVEKRFAQAQAEVSKADYDQLEEANRLADRAVTAVEVRRAKLDWKRAELAIEKATHDQELAQFDAFQKKAELDASDLAIKRRVITAPFDGMVEKKFRKQDEWVAPGDPILYLFRLDTVHVEGAVEQSKYDPHELQGCDVTVEVQLARGRKETVRGKITKVSSVVRLDGKFEVRAEVPNRQEHGTWLLRDGLLATMTIHLGTGGATSTDVTQRP